MRALRIVAGVLVLSLAGCGVVPAPSEPGRSAGPTATATDTVTRSLRDVERYWKAEFPALTGGKRFRPITGGFHPYTERKPAPDCAGEATVYQPNAFYCPDGDFIAWDAQKLIPQLQQDYGPLLVGVVMAHEYGHAIQVRLGRTRQPTVVLEQQADCYAGAWLADVRAGHSTAFRKPTSGQLDNTVAGLLMLRDQPGTSARAQGAHGNAFDRIRAFQEGIQQGAKKCAGYDANNLQVTEVPFSDAREAESGGDLPYDKAITLLAQDAQAYWTRTFPDLADRQWQPVRVETFDGRAPSCADPDTTAGGAALYCRSGDFIAFDGQNLGPQLYDRIGDFAVGMLLGDLFARAAQDRRGASTSGRSGQLAVDCLAGSWTNDLLTRDQNGNDLRLSPGDLDEAVAALLAFGRGRDNGGVSAFDRISAYRKGVLEGLGICV
ncbi:zinc metallopeptidase [Actinoplanes sp. KI2]|uniref:zinc metallopeptidase n=1 Tax=Actinoplanes sp. KI2 TaxID=2983315 RepID=UPI0021D57477|nr:zinc metallopeptidase [Actinoplanes sp. KI2]MCU7726021.1 zinc metallopeptidase [Actinoplanes sp. KI2]